MSIEKSPEITGSIPADEEPPSSGVVDIAAGRQGVAARRKTSPCVEADAQAASKIGRFTQSKRSRTFRAKHFPEATSSDWNNWHWQLCHSFTNAESLSRVLRLTGDEKTALDGSGSACALPVSVTPYYASLIDPDNPGDPIRKSVIPTTAEHIQSPGEAADPLGEDDQSPTPGLVHRYPDRVLFLTTEYCASYCRYCTRSRLVGRQERIRYRRDQWEKALAYIRATPTIRDVILSGGDPLTLPCEALEWLLVSLRAIKHVEVIRIGTKTPAVLPMRITPGLVKMIKRTHPVWMSLHFAHPDELTPETVEACGRLADAGAPLGSQTVLLKGVNDQPEVMRRLMTGLMKARVRPYYLYQCDPILGSAHLRTPVAKGIEIIDSLRGHVSGYAVPQYVIDAPGGGGKIPLLPEYRRSELGGDIELRNYQHRTFSYPDYGM